MSDVDKRLLLEGLLFATAFASIYQSNQGRVLPGNKLINGGYLTDNVVPEIDAPTPKEQPHKPMNMVFEKRFTPQHFVSRSRNKGRYSQW